MTLEKERITAGGVSLLTSLIVLWLSLWLAKASRIDFTPREKIGKGEVIEIVVPQVETQPSPQERRAVVKKTPSPVSRQTKRQTPEIRRTRPPETKVPPERSIPLENKLQETQQQKQEWAQAISGEEKPAQPTPSNQTEKIEEKPKQEQASKPALSQKKETSGEDKLVQYFARVKALVERRKRYPEEARRRGIEGVVVVKVSVGEDGTIQSVRIIRSGGSNLLDEETVKAVRGIGKLPPPPEGRPIEFNLEVEYKLGS